jgi:hypothetical protein
MPIPMTADALLTRDATAAALTEAGFPVKAKTLATKASRGGGPPFQRFGRKPLYRWGQSLEWAKNQLSSPMTSSATNDLQAVQTTDRLTD